MTSKNSLLRGGTNVVTPPENPENEIVGPLISPADIERDYDIPQQTQAKWRLTGDCYQYIKLGRNVRSTHPWVCKFLLSKVRKSTSDTAKAVA